MAATKTAPKKASKASAPERQEPSKVTEDTAGAVDTGTKGILNVSGVSMSELHAAAPENPTSPTPEHEKAVNALGDAVEQADGVIGHSEILAVVNRKLIDLQGTRDVLI